MPVLTSYTPGTFAMPGLCSGDAPTAKQFYSKLLNWDPIDIQMEGGTATMFKIDDVTVASMYQMADDRKKAGVLPHWNSYIHVESVKEITKKIPELGGKVKSGPADAEDHVMANIQDPTGVGFSVWESQKSPSDAIRINEEGALCWSELCTSDADASIKFYTSLLGWQVEPFDGSPMPYNVISVPECKEGFGGIMQITEDMQGMQPQWLPYFHVADIDALIETARKLGGQAHGPMPIPTVGRIAYLLDPEGANFAAITPDPNQP